MSKIITHYNYLQTFKIQLKQLNLYLTQYYYCSNLDNNTINKIFYTIIKNLAILIIIVM